jgi:hypothetical protein
VNALGQKYRMALRPDAQAFDEVRIITVPRWKTSGLSGDEWRISAAIEFWRKGRKIYEQHYRNVETACAFAYTGYQSAIERGEGFYGSDGRTCDQEGCTEPATVFLKLVSEYCRDGHKTNPYESDTRPLLRCFCEKHRNRGDCGLEDADRNYEPFEIFEKEVNNAQR